MSILITINNYSSPCIVSYLNTLSLHYQVDLSLTINSGVARKSSLGPLPSPSFTLPSFDSVLPYPPTPLRSRLLRIAARGSGKALSPPAGPPAVKRFLVHFKHYFNWERIEKSNFEFQNSPIWNNAPPLSDTRTHTIIHIEWKSLTQAIEPICDVKRPNF